MAKKKQRGGSLAVAARSGTSIKAAKPAAIVAKRPAKHRPGYSRRWTGFGFPLQEAEKAKLIEIAFQGSRPSEDAEQKADMIRQVEHRLGWYQGALEAVDNAPRPANMKAALELLRERCVGLINALDKEMNTEVRGLLERHGLDEGKFYTDLLKLIHVISLAGAGIDTGRSSTGRPGHRAYRKMVARLRDIFNLHFTGDRTERKKIGSVSTRSSFEVQEISFIETTVHALVRAGLPIPKIDVVRFFDDTLLMTPAEMKELAQAEHERRREKAQAKEAKAREIELLAQH